VGEIKVRVKYEEQEVTLPLLIAEGHKEPLFGKNWLSVIKLNWRNVFSCLNVPMDSKTFIDDLMNKYKSVFQGEGVVKTFKADIRVKPETAPKFMKARPVPYALREAVAKELDKLEAEGIVKKIVKSDWATPIVVVPK
jgi:hypothetical protein